MLPLTLLLALSPADIDAAAAAPIQCADEAIAQAQRLLSFHFGADDRIEIADDVRQLPALANPAQPEIHFQVLEVWGHIYKGQYRMRLIYHPMDETCVLMGQEILEHAQL